MMQIYSLYNKKVGFYNPPTYAQGNKEDIKVNLIRYCRQNQEDAKKAHFDECELYHLGEFDDIRCVFKLNDKPEFLVGLSEFFDHE